MSDLNSLFSDEDVAELRALLAAKKAGGTDKDKAADTQRTSPAPITTPVVPAITSNVLAGASLSEYSIPPWVASATVSSVVGHEFHASDLFKLDQRKRNSGSNRRVFSLGADGSMEAQEKAAEYHSLAAITAPLQVYFNILLRSLAVSGTSALMCMRIAAAFNAYTAQLTLFSAEYKFAALLLYHSAFFDSRVNDMSMGDYLAWGRIDIELQAQCLVGHALGSGAAASSSSSGSASKKLSRASGTSTQMCYNYNYTQCTYTNCSRRHVCIKCSQNGVADQAHPSSQCKASGSKA